MGEVLGDILNQGIGVALSPLPVVALILLLFSKQARSNGLAFLAGWAISLGVVAAGFFLTSDAGEISEGGTPSIISSVINLLLGLLLLYTAWKNWNNRSDAAEPKMPGWMASIDSFGAAKSFGFAVLFGGLNLKNLAMTAAAAMSISQAGLTGNQAWIVLAVFVIIGSITVIVPVLYYLFAGAAAEKTLNGWKAWLIVNNGTVMMVLFLVFGVKLVGAGLGGLLG